MWPSSGPERWVQQIAQQIALHGFSVALFDENPEQLARALASNRGHLERRVEKAHSTRLELDAALARVEPVDDLARAVEGASLVIEAIVEELNAKQALFQQLDRITGTEVLLATNSSSMTVSQIASELPGRERISSMHFFNPVLVMRLVEIAPAPFTRPGLVEREVAFVEAIDRVPVVLGREIEGLLANRIIAAIRREAFWLVEQGYATPEAIDTAIELGCGIRWGLSVWPISTGSMWCWRSSNDASRARPMSVTGRRGSSSS